MTISKRKSREKLCCRVYFLGCEFLSGSAKAAEKNHVRVIEKTSSQRERSG